MWKLGCLLLFCSVGWTWDAHHKLTRFSLNHFAPRARHVKYVPFEQAYKAPLSLFIEQYKLNKRFRFVQKLNEKAGQEESTIDVLAIYSDEPDWGMDQGLFEGDQYPELWTKDTKYVSQKQGLGSQGFRHMHFPGKWTFSEPIASLQIPMRALGEAPYRAQLYLNLAKQFFEENNDYWGYRMLAWVLHYAQDLHQPFHARQTPSKSFIQLQWKYRIIPTLDIPKTAEQIAYYHLSFEKWIDQDLDKATSPLQQALSSSSKLDAPVSGEIQAHLRHHTIPRAGALATRLGDATIKLFGDFDAEKQGVASKYVGTKQWQEHIARNPEAEKTLQEISAKLFAEMGALTRSILRTYLEIKSE